MATANRPKSRQVDRLTSLTADFTKDDVGTYIRLVPYRPWYRRLWYWIKHRLLRIPEPSNGVYRIVGISEPTTIFLEGAKKRDPSESGEASPLPEDGQSSSSSTDRS